MSYTPPPYAPQKKGTNPLVWVFVALGAFCCIAVIGFGAMATTVFRQVGGVMPCMMTMSIAQNALLEYEKEKGAFPAAATWQTDITEIYNREAKKITEEVKDVPGMGGMMSPQDISKELLCSTENPKTYLVYNSEIAGKKLADIAKPDQTILFFEAKEGGINAARPFEKLDPKDSPKMMGESRGWNVAYADGEVEFQNGKKSTKQRIEFNPGSRSSSSSGGSTPAPSGE
ncbi:MAG: hypothetical protein LCH41_13470 [Armatimonadetes bacterium]|nr:hypothetical protein [Armatimonadota bacterium]